MAKFKGITGHTRGHRGRTDEWLTPPEILKALGPFDLDPCAPVKRPWPTAKRHFTREDDGLTKAWWPTWRVFCNPPYGPETKLWLKRMAEHYNGIALVFARTDTAMFHEYVFREASGLLFLKGRLHFYDAHGKKSKNDSGGPSVLIAYGASNARCLAKCILDERLEGQYIPGPKQWAAATGLRV